jgi:exodeoxyribonuclease III
MGGSVSIDWYGLILSEGALFVTQRTATAPSSRRSWVLFELTCWPRVARARWCRVSESALKREAKLRRREAALVLRDIMSPRGAAVDRFRVATWNVNSLKVRAAALDRLLARAAPDVLLLQELKSAQIHPDAASVFERHGYATEHVGSGAFNGVAIASRHALSGVERSGDFGLEPLDREPRLISCIMDGPISVRVASVYVPHGREVGHWHYDYKLAFLEALATTAGRWLAEGRTILGGDINVAPTDSDVFHPDAFVGHTHVTSLERAAWRRLIDTGLVDVDAATWGPHERRFTWWNHGFSYPRNLGMRIDVLAADSQLAAMVDTTWIDHVERAAERPSDHAALMADFHCRQTEDRV